MRTYTSHELETDVLIDEYEEDIVVKWKIDGFRKRMTFREGMEWTAQTYVDTGESFHLVK